VRGSPSLLGFAAQALKTLRPFSTFGCLAFLLAPKRLGVWNV
jgi:hypothetical protein